MTSDSPTYEGVLRAAFPAVVARTFNAVTVDGDTSTNDMTAVLASGQAGEVDLAEFLSALEGVMRDLARQIAADGEGLRVGALVRNAALRWAAATWANARWTPPSPRRVRRC